MCNCSTNEYELIPELEMMLTHEYDFEGPQISSGTMDSKEYIGWIQTSLNNVLKLKKKLSVTGILDSRTKEAIRFFQKKSRIAQTSVPDNATEAALVKAGATPAPVHKATTPSDCANKRDITNEFWEAMKKVEAGIQRVAGQQLASRIVNEIHDILGPEGNVDIRKFKIFSCSSITNLLVMGETIGAEVFPDQQIVFISETTWSLVNEFLSKGSLPAIILFFQIIAHEKRHATLGNTVEVKMSAVKAGLDQMAAEQARYMVHEILVKAEEVAVGRTMNPAYSVPVDLQQVFRRNWNIASSIVTDPERIRLRSLIIRELRKRYLGGNSCDSSLTIGVLKSMETGQWFRCYSGSVYGTIPGGLNICKNADGTHKVCGIH